MLGLFNIFAHDVSRMTRSDMPARDRYVHPARKVSDIAKPETELQQDIGNSAEKSVNH